MSSDERELLQQFESRIVGASDPLEVLVDLLGSGSQARGRLFDLTGSTLAGCRLQRILGAGGMGVTYAGVAADGSAVAVKLVADVQSLARERFAQECRLLQSFDHAHIVRYRHHEVLADGTGALVMDRVQGIDLEQLLGTLASQDPRATAQSAVQALLQDVETRGVLWQSPRYRRRMLRLLADVADGLHAAHERGVVHRDVKPANILVRDDLAPVVIDFGLARDAQNRVSFTRSGAALGTLCYMAPEQLGRDSGAVDRRTDVYALGLVLFRAITGTELRSDVEEVMHSGRRSFLLNARQSRMLPVDIQAILYRCLDPRPSHRYPTAQLLAQDLRAAAGQGMVAASRPSLFALWLRDRRIVTVAALLMTSALALLTYWQWPRGRLVLFAANCSAADARIRVDGTRSAWLGDPIWLPFGTHRLEFRGSMMRSVQASFEVMPGDGQQWVPIVTFEEDRLRGDADRVGKTPVQFMTGHQWEAQAPGLPRDRRFVDGIELVRPEPVDQTVLSAGRHELRAVDGLGRTETLVVDVGESPLDVQLLPAVLADVGGSYRRTWSTVLSPRPDDFEISGNAMPWIGNWIAPLFGYGLQQAPCALVPSAAGQTASVQLRCRFPEPMRSAVVALTGSCQPAGELEVEAGFEGEESQPWPIDASGQLQPRLAFASPRGAKSLVISARMQSSAAPTSSLALVRLFDGRLFGGHWRDIPPCLAIAADPGDAASISPAAPKLALGSAPKIAELRRLPLPGADPRSQVLMLCPMPGPSGAMDLWVGMTSDDFSIRKIERRRWPDLALVSTLSPEALHPRTRWSDGRNFGQCMTTVPDTDGDGWSELALSDRSSEMRGTLYAGSAALLRSRELSAAWRWPTYKPTSQFGDDNACCIAEGGDWNGDGYPDLVMNATNGASAEGLQEAGIAEVVDGRTGTLLWHFAAAKARSHLEVRSALPLADGRGPSPIVLATTLRMSERDERESYGYSVWVGGKDGREIRGPQMPAPSAVALVRPVAGTGPLALLVYRCGLWQDQFVGIERHDVGASEFHLTHRVAIDHDPVFSGPPHLTIDYSSTQVDDLDGDGWLDAAFLVQPNETEVGCLFVSGRDASALGYVPAIHLRNQWQSRILWLPASGGQPAQLLLASLREEPGDAGPVIGSIIPPHPIRR